MLNIPSVRILGAAVLALTGATLSGCKAEGCLDGKAGCEVPEPCQKLSYTCSGNDALDVHELSATEPSPTTGPNALASKGDLYLTNGQVRAVIAGLGNQNYLDPNGGSLLDLAARETVGGQPQYVDTMNQALQVVGILPGDSVKYAAYTLVRDADRVGVQLTGALAGNPAVKVYTLYELRPCDPGIRIRTEVVNTSPDVFLFATSDGYYWSKREPIPFTPTQNVAKDDSKATDFEGFVHPSFGLTTINDAFQKFPYMATKPAAAPASSFGVTGCNVPTLEGFNSDTVSSAGLARTVVNPREYQVFERFIAVAPGSDAASSANLVLEARRQLFDEEYVTLSGTVVRPGSTTPFRPDEVSVVVSQGTDPDPAKRVAWNQATPNGGGAFSVRVPKGHGYHVAIHSLGKLAIERDVDDVSSDRDLGQFSLPSTGRVKLFVRVPSPFNLPVNAEVFVVPADEATRDAAKGNFHGMYGECSPWLGPPAGGSPACNKVLVPARSAAGGEGVTVEMVPGNYLFYGYHGPFWTIDMKPLSVTPTDQTLTLEILPLFNKPANALGADLHVHGSASFDSSIPDETRVDAFAASDMDVIVSTDHDVIYDYSQVLQDLGYDRQMTAVVGTETTGHNPWLYVPRYGFPLVIGHYNFWPLKYDPSVPRNGGPFDEYQEPGQLFDQLEDKQLYTGTSLIELNHPWADPEFGRDLGFPRAILMDTTKNLPAEDDGTNNGVYVRRAKDANGNLARNRNNAHHAQEVMNGTQNDLLLTYRAFWFYLLNQGQLRTGTANSDSHSLADNTIGSPRNLVFTSTRAGKDGSGVSRFDVNVFNQAIRDGHVAGTNGPLIEATLDDAAGGQTAFGLAPMKPAADAKLHLRVSAAPWVPIEEVRFVVNGKVVKKLSGAELTHPADPFGTSDLIRFEGDLALTELVTGTKDAWLVIEAGRPLLLAGDLGGGINNALDGIPDTTDNNNDGVVDAKDVDEGKKIGPIKNPTLPTTPADPQFHFSQVVHEGYPMAFTNPFVLDLNGNGQFDAPALQGN